MRYRSHRDPGEVGDFLDGWHEALELQIFDANVARFNLHRTGSFMQLNPDEPFHFTSGLVVVDNLAHHAAVDELDQHVSAGDDMDVVPVLDLDQALQL